MTARGGGWPAPDPLGPMRSPRNLVWRLWTGRAGGQVVLARPVTLNGHRVATIRVAEPLSETTDLIRRDLLVLLGVAALAVGLAAIVGSFLAERLARPLRAIRDDAVRLGDGDFAIAAGRTGMAEIDETAHALANTAERLESVLERERTFSANASHQLRTPVTSMRLAVESELQVPRTDSQMVLREVLTDLDRLEATIETLLAVARDIPLDRDAFDTETTASRILSRWEPPLTRGGRSLLVKASEQPPVKVSIAVFDEITDVLIDNAHRHGQGQIVVTVGGTDPGHVTLTVSDAGRMAAEPDSIFHRRHPDAERHGIGLALARSLAEAEGGRLVLTRSEPTTFRLLLPAWH